VEIEIGNQSIELRVIVFVWVVESSGGQGNYHKEEELK
jgi:hypothetical protein